MPILFILTMETALQSTDQNIINSPIIINPLHLRDGHDRGIPTHFLEEKITESPPFINHHLSLADGKVLPRVANTLQSNYSGMTHMHSELSWHGIGESA